MTGEKTGSDIFFSNQDPRNQELGPSRHHDSVRHTLQPCNLALYVLLLRLLPHPHLSYFRTSNTAPATPRQRREEKKNETDFVFLLPSLKGLLRPPLERPGPQSAFTFYKKQLGFVIYRFIIIFFCCSSASTFSPLKSNQRGNLPYPIYRRTKVAHTPIPIDA